jgi:TRAP-type mannitol/chloroaromatic compound transport system permease small subunit
MTLNRIVNYLDAINELIGSSVSWLTLAMMFITCLIVVARYVFNLGSIALQETVMYMHGMVFMLGIGYTLKHQGHVRVDIFYEKQPIRKKALIDLFGTLVFLLPIGMFIFLGSLNYVSFSWSLGESSAQPGGLPGVFLLKTLIPLMALLLVLQGLAEIGRSIILLTKADEQA